MRRSGSQAVRRSVRSNLSAAGIVIATFLVFGGVATSRNAHAQTPERRLRDPSTDCFERFFGSFAGVSFWGPPEENLRRFGRPLRQDDGTSEDDGGEYRVTFYRFARVDVTVNERNSAFERFFTADSTVVLGGGIRVGMTVDQVAQVLHVDPNQIGTNFDGSFCEADGHSSPSDGFTFRFDPAPGPFADPNKPLPPRRLRSVELTSYGP